MDMTTIILFVIGTVLAIIGFFTRNAYTSILKDVEKIKEDRKIITEDHGKLKGKLELLEQESRLKLAHIEENTQQEIKNMALKVGELSDMVGALVKLQMQQPNK